MKKFENHEEIKTVYDTNKYDIFYEKGNLKYEVRHIGSTVYCHDVQRNLGMGAVNNFDIDGFYGIERPEPVISFENVEEEPTQTS